MMKLCFFGLGSIGQKHIKNIYTIFLNKDIEIHAYRSTNKPLNNDIKKYIKKEIFNLDEMEHYDVIFITNPTSLHYETIQSVISKTNHMFIEKPLFSSIDDNIDKIPFNKNGIYYVACPLRYNPVINYIKNFLKNEQVYSVRSICSSYLPDWRPNIDYKKNYSALKSLGGGVSLDLIHEVDYITYLFGFPNSIINKRNKFSNLEIETDDLSLYLMEYVDKYIEVHLDYFGRVPRREIELYTKDDVIIGDLINLKISFLKEKKVIDLSSYENEEIGEMRYFFDCVCNNKKTHNEAEYAYKVLKLSQGEI